MFFFCFFILFYFIFKHFFHLNFCFFFFYILKSFFCICLHIFAFLGFFGIFRYSICSWESGEHQPKVAENYTTEQVSRDQFRKCALVCATQKPTNVVHLHWASAQKKHSKNIKPTIWLQYVSVTCGCDLFKLLEWLY